MPFRVNTRNVQMSQVSLPELEFGSLRRNNHTGLRSKSIALPIEMKKSGMTSLISSNQGNKEVQVMHVYDLTNKHVKFNSLFITR